MSEEKGIRHVELVICTLSDCWVCERLAEIIDGMYKLQLFQRVAIKFIDFGSKTTFAPKLSPRVFPTVIAYKNGVPRLGWEGFAAMAPEEIQDAMVLDVLQQAAALADEPDEAPAMDASSAAGAARSEADGGAP